MQRYINIVFLFVGMLLSCCCKTKEIASTKCECKEFKKSLGSLILYDPETEFHFFNQHAKVDIDSSYFGKDQPPKVKVYSMDSPSIIFKNKDCFLGKKVDKVKKMLHLYPQHSSNSFSIFPSIEQHNCLKKKIDCEKIAGGFSGVPKIIFSTETTIKQAKITINSRKYQLEFL